MDWEMNWDTVEHNWGQFRELVKQKWDKLTEHDLDEIKGSRDALVGKIEERYGISRSEAEQQLYDFESILTEAHYNLEDAGRKLTEASVISNIPHH